MGSPLSSPTEHRIAVRVQHHGSRAHLIPPLLAALRDFDDVVVVTDKGDTPDHWRSHRAVLEAMPEDATHLLALQDDLIVRAGLAERVALAIERRPESVLLAFVPGFARERRLMAMAQKAGEPFVAFVIGSYVPLVATIYPREVVNGLLAWATPRMHGPDDGIVAQFCRRRRIRPLMIVPCLVDHDDRLPSVGKTMRPGPHRRAALL